jgi:plasmid stability protein
VPTTTVAVTIRNIPVETHRAIKARAKARGRSTEAEMRAILDEAVRSEERVGLGTALAEFGRKYARELAGVDFDAVKDRTPAKWVDFSGPEFDRPEFAETGSDEPHLSRLKTR